MEITRRNFFKYAGVAVAGAALGTLFSPPRKAHAVLPVALPVGYAIASLCMVAGAAFTLSNKAAITTCGQKFIDWANSAANTSSAAYVATSGAIANYMAYVRENDSTLPTVTADEVLTSGAITSALGTLTEAGNVGTLNANWTVPYPNFSSTPQFNLLPFLVTAYVYTAVQAAQVEYSTPCISSAWSGAVGWSQLDEFSFEYDINVGLARYGVNANYVYDLESYLPNGGLVCVAGDCAFAVPGGGLNFYIADTAMCVTAGYMDSSTSAWVAPDSVVVGYGDSANAYSPSSLPSVFQNLWRNDYGYSFASSVMGASVGLSSAICGTPLKAFYYCPSSVVDIPFRFQSPSGNIDAIEYAFSDSIMSGSMYIPAALAAQASENGVFTLISVDGVPCGPGNNNWQDDDDDDDSVIDKLKKLWKYNKYDIAISSGALLCVIGMIAVWFNGGGKPVYMRSNGNMPLGGSVSDDTSMIKASGLAESYQALQASVPDQPFTSIGESTTVITAKDGKAVSGTTAYDATTGGGSSGDGKLLGGGSGDGDSDAGSADWYPGDGANDAGGSGFDNAPGTGGDTSGGYGSVGEGLAGIGNQLSKKFPFSIPWDLYNLFSQLTGTAVAPSVTLPGAMFGASGSYTVDLSPWNSVASVLRGAELLAFDVGMLYTAHEIMTDGE